MAKKIISVNSEKKKRVTTTKKSIPKKTEKKPTVKTRPAVDKKLIEVLKDFPIGIAVFDEMTNKYVYINEACKNFFAPETNDIDFLSEILPPEFFLSVVHIVPQTSSPVAKSISGVRLCGPHP